MDSSLSCSDSLMEFYLEVDLDFSLNMFRSAFIHSTHLSTKGPLGMIFQHFWNIFDPNDSTSSFSQLFLVCFYVVIRHIHENITKTLGATRMLTLAKPSISIWLIVVGEVFYWLMSRTLCLQFCNAFVVHLSFTNLKSQWREVVK